jgi:hypothetical protein
MQLATMSKEAWSKDKRDPHRQKRPTDAQTKETYKAKTRDLHRQKRPHRQKIPTQTKETYTDKRDLQSKNKRPTQTKATYKAKTRDLQRKTMRPANVKGDTDHRQNKPTCN